MLRFDKRQTEEYMKQFPMPDIFSFDIKPYVEVLTFDSDDMIMREGERTSVLYFLTEGRAKLFLTHDNGRVSLINFLDAPCFLGEMELLDTERETNGVKAITACTCYAIDISRCKERLLSDNKFLKYLCVFLSHKATQNTNHYSGNQSYPLQVRLARVILNMSYNGWYRERHTEIAEFLGVSYRHLLYVIADFVKKDILSKGVQGYHIEDENELRKLAGWPDANGQRHG